MLRDLVHCQAMQPEWVRRVHEALKMPAQAPKMAQNAPFSLHQQLLVARCIWAYAAVHQPILQPLLRLLHLHAWCHWACLAVPAPDGRIIGDSTLCFLQLPVEGDHSGCQRKPQLISAIRTGTASDRQAALCAILHWTMACEAAAEAAPPLIPGWPVARPQRLQQLAQGSVRPSLAAAAVAGHLSC